MKRKLIPIILAIILLLGMTVMPAQAATQAQIDDAIQDGLAWLSTQQNADGSWGNSSYPNYYYLANTATAVLAFENEGHFPGGGTPYSAIVEKGLNYIFTRAIKINIGSQWAGNPDTNNNGQGIYFSQNSYMYETGIVMQAIIASNTPGRVVSTGSCTGMTYRNVMVDLVDFCAWAQIDGGTGRGSWRYSYYNNGSTYGDNSVAQWPVLGLVAAEQWGIKAPQFVKNELQYWVTFIQRPDGASGYDVQSSYPNVAKTGGLLVEFFYLGDVVSAPRVQKALNYINSKWGEVPTGTWYGNKGHPYAMFSVFKGLELYKITTIPNAPAHSPDTVAGDWWGDYCHYLVGNQTHVNADQGYWTGIDYWQKYLATPWYIIILQASVFPVSVDIEVPSVACDDNGYDVSVNYSVERFYADGTLTVYKDGAVYDTITLTGFKGSATANYNLPTADLGPHTWKAVLTVTGSGITVTTEDTDSGNVYDTPQVSGIPDQYAPFSTFDLDDYQTCTCTNVTWAATGVPAGWTVNIDAEHIVTIIAPEGATEPAQITFVVTFHWPGIDCTDSDTATFSPNRPPIADAGKDYGMGEYYEVLEGSTVELDGSRSYDPDGDALISYDWDLNEDGTFETPGMIVTFSAAGLDNPQTKRLYVFLKVVDEHGAEGVDQARVNILDGTPTADFGWDKQNPVEGMLIQYIDFSTSPVDAIVSWQWDFGNGNTSTAQVPPAQLYCDNGEYQVSLTVTDDDGSQDTVTKTLVVANAAPIIDILKAEPASVQCYKEPITFTGIGKDPGCDTLTVVWDFGDGKSESYDFPSEYNSVVSHTYEGFGDYTVTLTVTDDDGGTVSKTVQVAVWDKTPPKLEGKCVQSVNPNGNNVPGKNRDKNGKGDTKNVNPDGFYLLDFTVTDNCDDNPQLWVGTADNPYMFQVEPGITVKFTESIDAVPEMKKIGSPPQGGATAVTWHIILPSDPVLTAKDASGNFVQCITCLVPPPPM